MLTSEIFASSPVSDTSVGGFDASVRNGSERARVSGKFFRVGDRKFYVKGVTYGPFAPEPDGSEYHTREMVERDFALMASRGLNSVRTYTVPPRWLLDIAHRHGLWIMIGVPWEQHIAFLDQPRTMRQIEERVSKALRGAPSSFEPPPS